MSCGLSLDSFAVQYIAALVTTIGCPDHCIVLYFGGQLKERKEEGV